MKRNYLVVIERTRTGYSAYPPDVPGCVATGSTRQRTEHRMREALAFHPEGLREDGMSIPKSTSTAAYITVAA